VKLNM